MSHLKWCGKPCKNCLVRCETMQDLGCFLDCPAVRTDGAITGADCAGGACPMFGEDEGKCPVCGTYRTLDGESMPDEDSVSDSWKCTACGASVRTTYSLQFSRHALNRPVPGVML